MHLELFGEHLRRKRVEARLSLRELAKILGLSHTYLGEVERGECGPLSRDFWPKIVDAIPGVTLGEIEEVSFNARRLSIDLSSLRGDARAAAVAFAQRVADGTLSEQLGSELLVLLLTPSRRSKTKSTDRSDRSS